MSRLSSRLLILGIALGVTALLVTQFSPRIPLGRYRLPGRAVFTDDGETVADQLRANSAQIERGKVAIQIPRSVAQWTREAVIVRVAAPGFEGDLAYGLDPRVTMVRDIDIGARMTAQLTHSDSDFVVDHQSSAAQFLEVGGWTEWDWQFVARHHGTKLLTARLAVLLEANGRDIPHAVPAISREVRVHFRPVPAAEHLITDHAKAIGAILGSSAFLSVVSAAWAALRKRRSARTSPPQGVAGSTSP